jgi:hypothetical protein
MQDQGNEKAKDNSVVAVFDDHAGAETAIKQLQHAGIPMNRLSVVGKDFHTEEHVIGYYNAGDRMKFWGKLGAFWGGLAGLLFGSAFFLVPGVGPLMVLGPLASWIIGGLEGAVVVGGLSALGGGLFSLGIPKDSVLRYESEVKAGRFLVVANGTPDEVSRARAILNRANAREVSEHQRERIPTQA